MWDTVEPTLAVHADKTDTQAFNLTLGLFHSKTHPIK